MKTLVSEKTDIFGEKYGPGDVVMWSPAGRIKFGEVVRFTACGTTVYPLTLKGKEMSLVRVTRTIYIDRRTGARIPDTLGYLHTPTGKFYTYEDRLQEFGVVRYVSAESSVFKYVTKASTMTDVAIAIEVYGYPVTIQNYVNVVKCPVNPVKEENGEAE